MQILRSGMSVRARRRRWRIVDVRVYDDCQLLTLAGDGNETRLLVPFDSIEPLLPSPRPRLSGPACWRRACRTLLASNSGDHQLRAAVQAGIDLLPYQLEPAIALVRGDACRLLLADDVGLGKTIQAGLAIAELRARGAADRVLIVTPAGLRDQWVEELSRRFNIQSEMVDFRTVAQRTAALPSDVNPWTTWPIAVASIDYVKRAEVLPAVAAASWDAIVVDEAHGLAGDSDRHEAVAALAARVPYVVLLTATPHSGDAGAFGALCALGSRNDSLLIFRRTRKDVQQAAPRHVHRLLTCPSADECRMHALLSEFERAVRDERGDNDREMWLALTLLYKRAYSSAHALWLSVSRRLSALDGQQPAGNDNADEARQLALPLESDDDDLAPPWAPAIALRDHAVERRLLTTLAEAAEAAARSETKLAALSRLLRRVAEPVIVFTEYRDTLAHVARHISRPLTLLHGGLSRQERAAALRTFAEGSGTVLLATDAAGEGLNLQRTCRTVVNLELPWNPMRLEQRIGRVDRIGQQRTVHAFHLIASGTGEERLLGHLFGKIALAQADIGAANPLGSSRANELVVERTLDTPQELTGLASYNAEADAEARRLEDERVTTVRAPAPRVHPNADAPLVTFARNRHTRRRLGARVLLIWELRVDDGCGRPVASATVGTAFALTRPLPQRMSCAWTDGLIETCARDSLGPLETSMAPFFDEAMSAASAFLSTRLARERSISVVSAMPAFQPGLFDRRAHHAQAAARAAQQDSAETSARRAAQLKNRAWLSARRLTLRLVILP